MLAGTNTQAHIHKTKAKQHQETIKEPTFDYFFNLQQQDNFFRMYVGDNFSG